MASHSRISEEMLQDLTSELRLCLDPEYAAELSAPITDIIASMDPVSRPPSNTEKVDRPAIHAVDTDDPYNAFITRCAVREPEATGLLDDSRVALKDNIALTGVELTAGSGILSDCIPTRNATVTDRLLEAGATIVGKTNMDEFAFGPTGETSYYGPTQNPRMPDHTPGGSSSGSGAAVAAGDADIALGTDTGGSVRIPASYCGVVGYKPTQGLIPLDGVVELAGSLDTVGVLADSVEDASCGAAVLARTDALADPEMKDPESVTIGIPDTLFDDPVAESVANHVADLIDQLVDRGAKRVKISLPDTSLSSAIWRVISMSELYMYFFSNGRPYRSPAATEPPFGTAFANARSNRLEKLSDPLTQYLLIGAYLVTRDDGDLYANAIEHRAALRDEVDSELAGVDVLACPSTPTTAYEFGEFSRDSSPPINNNTHLFNLTGHPAISVPCGTIDGLPVGIQTVGARDADAELLEIARTVQNLIEESN
ncbi:amidase [Natrinema gelatinilyticum]|uniref:amidase n=1 Tax=Natrinema gelatinilyticum TaxID=2961571 RepID=UPI0020C2E1F8|nr:amidase [Natrinema gelatinilyticum]